MASLLDCLNNSCSRLSTTTHVRELLGSVRSFDTALGRPKRRPRAFLPLRTPHLQRDAFAPRPHQRHHFARKPRPRCPSRRIPPRRSTGTSVTIPANSEQGRGDPP